MLGITYYDGQSESLPTGAMTTVMCESVLDRCLSTVRLCILRDVEMDDMERTYVAFRYRTHLNALIPVATTYKIWDWH